MTILDRNSGTFTNAGGTTVTVSRSAGSFGTGTVLVVVVFGNTTIGTPGGWTLRDSSVVNLGLYVFEKAGAGEASVGFTAGVAGSGQWYVWELAAGAAFDVGDCSQAASSATSVATPSVTPAAGAKHLLAVAGGTNPTSVRSVTGFDSSFALGAGGQASAQDWPFSAAAERDVTAAGAAYSTTATFSASAGGNAGGILLAYGTGGDTTAPTVPGSFQNTAVGSSTADFSWVASSDDTGVTGYQIQVVGG